MRRLEGFFVLSLVILVQLPFASFLGFSSNSYTEKENVPAGSSQAQAVYSSSYGAPEKQYRWYYPVGGTANVVAVARNGSYAVMGTGDGYVYLFDTSKSSPYLDAAFVGIPTTVVAISGKGNRVAAVSGNRLIVYNITAIGKLQYLSYFDNNPGANPAYGSIRLLSFSEDGNFLAVGTRREYQYNYVTTSWVHLFNLTTISTPMTPAWSKKIHEGQRSGPDTVSVDISQDGKYIVAGSTEDKSVYLFNRTSSTPMYPPYLTGASVNSVAMSASGQYFVAGSDKIYYFSKDAATPILPALNISATVNTVSMSSNGVYIGAAAAQAVYLVKNDNSIVWQVPIGSDVGSASISADGQYLVARSSIYIFFFSRVLDPAPETTVHESLWYYNTRATVNSVGISETGRFSVAGSGNSIYLFDSNFDCDLAPKTISFSKNLPKDGDSVTISAFIENNGNLKSPVASVQFFFDNIWVGTSQIASINEGKNVTATFSLTVSPNGNHTISLRADPDNLVYESNETNNRLAKDIVIDPFVFSDTGANPIVLDLAPTSTLNSMSISSNGYYGAAGASDNSVYVFYRNQSKLMWNYATGGQVSVVAVAGDGSYIAAAQANTLYLFSRATNKPLWNFTNDPGPAGSTYGSIWSLRFSEDGSFLAVGTRREDYYWDVTKAWVHLFNITRGNVPVWSYKISEGARSADAVSVDISHNGEYVTAGSSWEGKVFVFRRTSQTPIHTPYTTGASVNSVAMSADGNYFAAGGSKVYYFSRDDPVPIFPSLDLSGTVNSVSISDSGNYTVATVDTRVYVLQSDLQNGFAELWNYDLKTTVSQALLSGDGNYTVARSGNFAYVFSRTQDGNSSASAHDPLWSYDTKNAVNSVSISSDGRYSAIASDGKAFLFDEQHKPDLRPTKISFSKSKPSAGETVTVSATINNTGAYKSFTANVSFYDGSLLIGQQAQIIPLSPSSSIIVSRSYQCRPGNRTIRVIVDGDNQVYESSETNNQLQVTLEVSQSNLPYFILPAGSKYVDSQRAQETDETRMLISINLAGQGQVVSVAPGQTVTGTATYQIYAPSNPNEINQGFFIMSWTPSWPPSSQYYIGLWNGGSGVYPGVTKTSTFSFTAPSQLGTYYLYWCGGSEYSIANAVNKYSQSLTVPAHAQIIVKSDTVTPVYLYKPSNPTFTSLYLTWTRYNNSDFLKYEIYMSTSTGSVGSLIATISNASQTSYNKTGLQPSTTYYFTIRTINQQAKQADSNQQFERTKSYHDIIVTQAHILLNGNEVQSAYVGNVLTIEATLENQGIYSETFDVTLYRDSTIIDTKSQVHLSPGNSTVLTFAWNTTGMPGGSSYSLRVVATTVSGEIDTANNTFTLSIRMLGPPQPPFWTLDRILWVVMAIASIGTVGIGVPRAYRRHKNAKKTLGLRLTTKGRECMEKGNIIEAAESFADAYLANLEMISEKKAKESIGEYGSLLRTIICETVLQNKNKAILEQINRTQNRLKKNKIVAKGTLPREISDIDVLLEKARSNDLDFIVDVAAAEGTIQYSLNRALKGKERIDVKDLASQLQYTPEATLKLLSKSISQNKINGYVTFNGQQFVFKDHLRRALEGEVD